MSSSVVKSNKQMKRMESRKSHSWWWDSHISPKNSKWLAENLEEMDRSIKRMLKLIEEDGDSLAKKAEMYYQRRPELISHVEEFYRMYRSLAERYDNVTGELRKNIPSDLQSQGSSISDIVSELPSTWPSPGPDKKPNRRKSGPRAAGFDFFLGSGGSSSDLCQKEGDESSTLTDSETESDNSSVNNYAGISGNSSDQGLTRKIIELEVELREMREKLTMQQDESGDGSFTVARNDNSVDLLTRIERYEHELKVSNERIQLSQEEITRLNNELQKYKSQEFNSCLQTNFGVSAGNNVKSSEAERESEMNQSAQLVDRNGVTGAENLESNSKIQALAEELRITRERLKESEKEITSLKHQLESNVPSEKERNLQDQLASAYKDINTWKTKLNSEKKEVSKLQERVARLKSSLTDRDHEIRDLKTAVSDAEEKIFPEKAQIKAKISRLLEERTSLEEQLKELESRGRSLEDDIRRILAEKTEIEESLNSEILKLETSITERDSHIENLYKSLDVFTSERDTLTENINTLKAEVVARDDRIDQMDKHLHQLHMEHVKLIAGAEQTSKLVHELRSKAKDLEDNVERQRIMILEGAEEKREAIRQLCFSIEHYRNGYQMLRQAFVGHKRVPVLAA